MGKIVVAGGGAAGMMAAVIAAERGNQVTLFEKNEKLGKKLFITGKGRCNITNACDMETLFDNVVSNSKFLYSSFYAFSNYDVIQFFEECGLKTKIERGGRVFPESDKSSDVIEALRRRLLKSQVQIEYNSKITELVVQNGQVKAVKTDRAQKSVEADAVIVATGGLSYRTTGSTGDGYEFAKGVGHTVTGLSPSLVPFNIKEEYIKELQGLSLKNIRIWLKSGNKEIFSDFGEMLFTHFGVSGPVILSSSSYAVPYLQKKDLTLTIDLKPALSKEQLDGRILRDFEEFRNKQYKNSLEHLLPRKLIPVIISLSGIDPDKKVNAITREERTELVNAIKELKLHISSIRDYNEAIITRGGISVKEVNPSTMESKLVKGLYFAGETLDLDALTGGFNLQIAWSTGYAAGNAV